MNEFTNHQLFVFRTKLVPRDDGHVAIYLESKYRNEVLPLEDNAGEYVTNTQNDQGDINHAQIVPLETFNQIMDANDRRQFTQAEMDKIAQSNTLLTKASDNLAYDAVVNDYDGIKIISLDSIHASENPFYYSIEQKAEQRMRNMHIQTKKIRK